MGTTQDIAAGSVNQQVIQDGLDTDELCGNVLTQCLILAQLLRSHALHNLLRLIDQFVECPCKLASSHKPSDDHAFFLIFRLTSDVVSRPITRDQIGPPQRV